VLILDPSPTVLEKFDNTLYFVAPTSPVAVQSIRRSTEFSFSSKDHALVLNDRMRVGTPPNDIDVAMELEM